MSNTFRYKHSSDTAATERSVLSNISSKPEAIHQRMVRRSELRRIVPCPTRRSTTRSSAVIFHDGST